MTLRPAARTAVWPAAWSPLTACLVHGPVRVARVAAAFPAALYLLVAPAEPNDLDDALAALLPVLAPGALQLPGGLRLARPADGGWQVAVGDQVRVGEGRVELPGATVQAVRAWRPPRVAPAPPGAAGAAITDLLITAAPSPHLVRRAGEVAAAVLAGRADGATWAPLVGAGPGLTPSGDDALCGALLALHAWGRGVEAAALAPAYPRTTALSAALIEAARQGFAVPEVVALADAVLTGDVLAVQHHLPAALAIGHSSGRDLVAGLLGAVQTLTVRLPYPEVSLG